MEASPAEYRAEFSSERDKLIAALADFHSKMETIPRTNTAKITTQSGQEYTYKFSDLSDTHKATRQLLTQCGLHVHQQTEHDPFHQNCVFLVTTIHHVESAQWSTSYFPISMDSDTRRLGAKLTYMRRYALNIALDLTTEDPDGDLEAAAITAIAKLKDEIAPQMKELVAGERTDKAEDKLLELINRLDQWEYEAVWKEFTSKEKPVIREWAHAARKRAAAARGAEWALKDHEDLHPHRPQSQAQAKQRAAKATS